MTHVDWNPVTVSKYGKIIKGKRPYEGADVYVTRSNGDISVSTYMDDADGFGDGYPHYDLALIVAWAHVIMPEPYRPEGEIK